MAEIEDGFYECERCGKVKPIASACASCGEDRGEGPVVPEGWDPELTRSSRPRLGIVGRPERRD